jgi:hypothetical protein
MWHLTTKLFIAQLQTGASASGVVRTRKRATAPSSDEEDEEEDDEDEEQDSADAQEAAGLKVRGSVGTRGMGGRGEG